MRRGDLSDLAGDDLDDGWGEEATPARGITPEASAAFYARRAAGLEDPPDGCDWCGDRSKRNGHRGCTNEPLPPAEQERYWQRYHAARAWALVDGPAA